VTYGQAGEVCPQCGSSAAVHAIQELAALAQARLGQQPGYGAAPQQGWAAEPQTGPEPGYAAQPRPGPPPGSWQRSGARSPGGDNLTPGEDLAGLAMTTAARFIGRAMGRRVQRTNTRQVLPTLAAHAEALLREQIAIAERYPDLRACLTDQVIFLSGGSHVLPMPNLATLTLEQSDALVATLRSG
jgi:hypothetical protein